MEPNSVAPPKIRYLVLSGGATILLQYCSVLKESLQENVWNWEDLTSTYSTSAGSLSMIMVSLAHHVGWDLFEKFLIHRPWQEVFDFGTDQILRAYSNVGIFNKEVIVKTFEPLLAALDLSCHVTLQEFFAFNQVDMHFMVTRLSDLQVVDISHTTHPDWELMDVLYASSALPVLFRPFRGPDGELYADGALTCNYPTNVCLAAGANMNEVLALVKTNPSSKTTDSRPLEFSNIFGYLADISIKIMSQTQPVTHVPFEVECCGEHSMALKQIYDICNSPSMRLAEWNQGKETWKSQKHKLMDNK
jgi:predicted acylesterase/phospholipase RssA